MEYPLLGVLKCHNTYHINIHHVLYLLTVKTTYFQICNWFSGLWILCSLCIMLNKTWF